MLQAFLTSIVEVAGKLGCCATGFFCSAFWLFPNRRPHMCTETVHSGRSDLLAARRYESMDSICTILGNEQPSRDSVPCSERLFKCSFSSVRRPRSWRLLPGKQRPPWRAPNAAGRRSPHAARRPSSTSTPPQDRLRKAAFKGVSRAA